MAHKYSTFFKWINVLIDYVILNLALYTFFATADFGSSWISAYDYRLVILFLNLSWFFCSNVFEIYTNVLVRQAVPIIIANIAAVGLFTIIASGLRLVLPTLLISTSSLVYFFFLFGTSIIFWKTSFLLLRRYRRRFWLNYNKCIIIGAGPAGINLYNYISSNPQLGYDVLGVFDDNPRLATKDINYLGRINDCMAYASANNVHEVYCALSTTETRKIDNLMQQADQRMVRFRLVPDFKITFDKDIQVELCGNMPILVPRQEPLDNKANEIIKWSFDFLFSSLVCVFLLSWLVPIIAIIIKLDSQGPVFFKQLRSGKDNKPFYCYKFRSMAPNNDSDCIQACKGDMRITRVGAFLRKTSLDELPQFFNVLMGDMSVVGPRPHMLKHTEDYSMLINNYMVRQFLTPGITGWAQINGYRGETKETSAMVNRVEADIWYLEHWSLFLDLKIVFLTIWRAIIHADEKAY